MASKLIAHESATLFFSRRDTEIGEKVIFWVKRSVPENVQREIFLGLLPTESLCTKDSENVVDNGWQSLRFEVTGAQREIIGQKRVSLRKIRGVKDQSNSANFGPISSKGMEPGFPISEPIFYSFRSDQTKIGRVTLIFDTAIA